ncbi:hypothetical protein N9J19_00495 [bacterium]|nr:hypothetical protein [bacterium]
MANLKNLVKTAFNLGKGKLLEKPRTGEQSQFNLNSFMGQLQEVNSLAQASKYTVEVFLKSAPWANTEDAQRLIFFCDSVNLPGGSNIASDFRSQGFGPFDRRPTAFVTPDISAQFMLDSNGNNIGFLQNWMVNVTNINASKPHQEVSGAGFGEIYYRDNYLSTLVITQYDVAGNPTTKLTAHEAWPSVLGDVALGWNNTDEVARVLVNFSLRYWTTEQMEGTPAPGERELSGFEQLLRIGSAAKALKASMKKPNNVGDVINIASNAQTFLGSFGGKRSGGG